VTTDPTRPSADLEAVDRAFALVAGAVTGLTDADARGSSHLPGWTRGHVLTHLARNADGQRRMVEGAIRDDVLDQYPGGDEQRAGDIEAGADRPAAALLIDLHESQDALVAAWALMPDGGWNRLTHARAGTRPVRDGVMSRWRELMAHGVDLDVGITPAQLPADYRERDADWLQQYRPTW
jgi:maleylpyruvate isomerase